MCRQGDKGKDNPAVDDEGEGSLTGIPAVKKFETEMGDDDFEEVGPRYQLGSPEDSASFLSKLVVGYADPLLNRACKKTLTEKDLWRRGGLGFRQDSDVDAVLLEP